MLKVISCSEHTLDSCPGQTDSLRGQFMLKLALLLVQGFVYGFKWPYNPSNLPHSWIQRLVQWVGIWSKMGQLSVFSWAITNQCPRKYALLSPACLFHGMDTKEIEVRPNIDSMDQFISKALTSALFSFKSSPHESIPFTYDILIHED